MQKLIIITIGFLFIAACHSNHNTSDIKLNNGDKWEVNVEMKPHIDQGNQILNDFLSKKDTDYKKLAEDLKNQNNQLVERCTMKGESHEELHKWLHPHMSLVEKLADTNDPKEAEAIVAQLEQSFKTYQLYFK